MSSNNQPNTLVDFTEEDDANYSEELKLNIRCDDDNSHIAVLYCTYCKSNLCKVCADCIHTRKSMLGHQIVRLTQKPESPIKCRVHPLREAELICKEPSCDGMSNPMCTMCHQYVLHKGHKYAIIDDEYDQIRAKIRDFLKEIENQQAVIDKNRDKFDKCILTYSTAEDGLAKIERAKIDKFYEDAKTSALQNFDNFVSNRVEELKLLRSNYSEVEAKLDQTRRTLQNIEEMKKIEVIQNGDNVAKLIMEAAEKIVGPSNLLPFECYNVIYPDIESIHTKIDLSENVRNPIQAVFGSVEDTFLEQDNGFELIEDKGYSILYKHKNGQNIMYMEDEPDEDSIDLLRYKYTSVTFFDPIDADEDEELLKEQIAQNWWSRIFVFVFDWDLENQKELVDNVRQIAETDERVEVMEYKGDEQLVELLLQS